MAKLTKKSFQRLDPSAIGRLKAPELRELLRGARQLFSAQEKTFKKYEKSVFSPALDKMQGYYEDNGMQSVSRMRVAKMRNEIFRLQEFFDSQSSTVPGARKIAIEQDKRIFGSNEKGKPAQRMTLEQRTNFWAAYQEFVSMQKESYVRNMGSNTIQQYLGQMVIEASKRSGRDYGFGSATDYAELRRRLEEEKAEEDWEMNDYEYGDSDIFSGKRPY